MTSRKPPAVRLLQGDSRLILPTLADQSFDVVATDPPYGIPMWVKCAPGEEGQSQRPGFRFDWHIDDCGADTVGMAPASARKRDKVADSFDLIQWTLEQSARLLADDGYLYMTLGDNLYSRAVIAARALGFKVKTWAWVKPNPMMPFPNSAYRNNVEMVLFGYRRLPHGRNYGGGGAPNYHVENAPRGKARTHPTQKPQGLFEAWLRQTPGRTLDPFMGVGTSMAACAALGLPGLGIDNNPEYVETAKSRVRAIRATQSAA